MSARFLIRRQPCQDVRAVLSSETSIRLYLHYVFDLWAERWRHRPARGNVILVRYADDIVAGFEHRADAERFQAELQDRLARFALSHAVFQQNRRNLAVDPGASSNDRLLLDSRVRPGRVEGPVCSAIRPARISDWHMSLHATSR